MFTAGNTVMMLALVIWLSVGVGPLWLGPTLIVIVMFIDRIHIRLLEKKQAEHDQKLREYLKQLQQGTATGK